MKRVLWGGTAVSLFLFSLVVLVLVVSPLAVQTAKADNLYARIQGVVTDPSGAVLAGTKLTATTWVRTSRMSPRANRTAVSYS